MATYLKIVIIGDQGVGKTALLDSLQYQKISKTAKPTIGADFMKRKITLDDGREVNLQLWDTAGQERFQSLCTSFYRGADCCVIVYDVNDEYSYRNIKTWHKNFENATQVTGVPFVLVGNKLDLGQLVPESRVTKDWPDFTQFQTSALTNLNVEKVFTQVANLGLQFQQANSIEPAQNYNDGVKLGVSSEKSQGFCC